MSSSEENKNENQSSSAGNSSGSASGGRHSEHLEMIQEIRELTSQTRLWRIGSVVAVLLIIALFALSIVNHVNREFPRTDDGINAIAKKFQESANVSLIPKVKKMVQDTLADSRDEVSTQLRLLWETRGKDVVSSAADELDLLARNVPQKAIDAYRRELDRILSEKLGGFKLPEGGSGTVSSGKVAKAINEGLLSSSTNRIPDIISVMFKPHVDELSMMSNHLNTIYDKEYGAMAQREKQFTLSMALVLTERMHKQLQEVEETLKSEQERLNEKDPPGESNNKK
jgi:hypothetical protein